MEEIAPEYDVIVLGTGSTTRPRFEEYLDFSEANGLAQDSLNASFQGICLR